MWKFQVSVVQVADNKMTIQLDEIIENLHKTVRKQTVLKREHRINTIEQVELCKCEQLKISGNPYKQGVSGQIKFYLITK